MTKSKKKSEEGKSEKAKLTYGELRLILSSTAYTGIMGDKLLPGKMKILLLRLSQHLSPAIEAVELVRVELLQKYCHLEKTEGKRIVNGKEVPPKPRMKPPEGGDEKSPKHLWVYDIKDREKFDSEWEDVLNGPAELTCDIVNFSEKEIPESVSALDMLILEKLIKFGD